MVSDQPASAALGGQSLTTTEWEQKLAQLRATNAELQRRLTDTEKDRELFHEMYGKASAHAGEVSTENDKLLERAVLAEGQAHAGVAMVEATYGERVRLLELEVARWKGQCRVFTERDRRTDDEVRRRAALEMELSAENAQLRGQLEGLEEDYRRMESLLETMTRQQVEETSALESTVDEPVLAPVEL